MAKMMTDEPSVIMRLKKGGKVAMKKGGKAHHEEHDEHKSMNHCSNAMYSEEGEAPKKPSMSDRRKAMNPQMLKKGGKVAHKAMGGTMGGLMGNQMPPQGMPAQGMPPQGMTPPRPMMKRGGSTSAEIKKMERELKHHEHEKDSEHGGRAHMKHGGKVHKVSGHKEGTHEHHKAMAKHHARMHKEGGSAHHEKMHAYHQRECVNSVGSSKEHYADGGMVDRYQTRTTIETKPKKFLDTHVENADRRDKHHGTGEIKETNGGGYKRGGKVEHHKEHHYAKGGRISGSTIPNETNSNETRGKSRMGGTIEGNEHYYQDTDLHSSKPQGKTRGTGKVEMSNLGGYKRGGKVEHHEEHHEKHMSHHGRHHYANGGTIEGNEMKFAQNNVDGTPHGKTHTKTGQIEEANAGGYKRGGHASKKHYALGGHVNDIGRATAYPVQNKSSPVSNSMQSGTYKKGGEVKHKRFACGGDVTPTNSPDMRSPEKDAMKRLLGIGETVAPKAKTR